ncbi:hypothetical protein [Streptomyces sp. CB03238]|uniref:hypothetical protein n=1 Tax=Streptomyces sp. CB03238 TaxID=1907777 RepID=UPI000A102D03|nr:hypothetical protein [Streptomyces sp. CB03238]ORT61318.1 hypothetical protein BKD26_04410 [Streptomyces sp. CB03238]
MGSSEGRRTVRRPQAGPERQCPTCRQPVGTVLKRRKILGVWAPVWEPGPCRNPGCERYADELKDDPEDGRRGGPQSDPRGGPQDEPGKNAETG